MYVSPKKSHCTVVHGPKLALRGVTSHLVTGMCMHSHAIVGVSPQQGLRGIVTPEEICAADGNVLAARSELRVALVQAQEQEDARARRRHAAAAMLSTHLREAGIPDSHAQTYARTLVQEGCDTLEAISNLEYRRYAAVSVDLSGRRPSRRRSA
eukprot:COSAG01_NODE_704_length_14147_cov_5.083648_1_plen_153_part_10